MLEKYKGDRAELVFLLLVAVFTVLAYIETTTFMPTSATVPQLILYLIGLTLVLNFVMVIWGDAIKKRVGLTDASAGLDIGEDDEEGETQTAGLYKLNPIGVTREMIWIAAYVLGITYVGFFTVSTAFCLVYILVNETSPLRRRIPIAVLWTTLIMGLLYLLFIEFLRVSSVWRLGFLP